MNYFEQGYCDQLRGVFKAHLLEGTASEAQAYRAGARCCRADIAAEEEEADLDEAFPPPPASYLVPVPDWSRRLSEFRGLTAGCAIESNSAGVGTPPPVNESKDPLSGSSAARLVHTVDGFVATAAVRSGQLVYVDDLENTKRAKKPNKAKPIDEGQRSLF